MDATTDYKPESVGEELFELVGRVQAFAAYVNSTEYSISRELCAGMLGFKLKNLKTSNDAPAVLEPPTGARNQ